MNPRNPLIVAAIIFFVGFSLIAAFIAFQIWGAVFMLFSLLLFSLGMWLALRTRYVLIDEMEVGVTFNRFNNSFCRFIPETEPKPRYGCKEPKIPLWAPFSFRWLERQDPHYVRLKWYETLSDKKITKRSQSASGKTKNIRTADGILVNITWKVSFIVNVYVLTDNIRHKLARTLPENADKVVKGKAERAIKHLVETRLAEELYQDSTIQRLEAEIAQNVYNLLALRETPDDPESDFIFNLGFQPIPERDVSLGPIEMPIEVEKALETAHQRRIHTDMVTEAMNRLHEAIGRFDDNDMKRLEKLEKLRILDEKDVESIHLAKVFVGKQE
ncbi:SPFH domain-containing protein [Candidatus Leptofilum sp.]|uniref:SPFH domain-containing protein n=1 Tax=Candidatus Leptofilum sp. TaxID=3241576 RepID=UPI003B58B6F1